VRFKRPAEKHVGGMNQHGDGAIELPKAAKQTEHPSEAGRAADVAPQPSSQPATRERSRGGSEAGSGAPPARRSVEAAKRRKRRVTITM